MEMVVTVAMLIAVLVIPAMVVTAIAGGMIRRFGPVATRRTGFIAVIGSLVPALMLAIGICASWRENALENASDTLSIGWWFLTAALPAWVACLPVAWWIAPRPCSRGHAATDQ